MYKGQWMLINLLLFNSDNAELRCLIAQFLLLAFLIFFLCAGVKKDLGVAVDSVSHVKLI